MVTRSDGPIRPLILHASRSCKAKHYTMACMLLVANQQLAFRHGVDAPGSGLGTKGQATL